MWAQLQVTPERGRATPPPPPPPVSALVWSALFSSPAAAERSAPAGSDATQTALLAVFAAALVLLLYTPPSSTADPTRDTASVRTSFSDETSALPARPLSRRRRSTIGDAEARRRSSSGGGRPQMPSPPLPHAATLEGVPSRPPSLDLQLDGLPLPPATLSMASQSWSAATSQPAARAPPLRATMSASAAVSGGERHPATDESATFKRVLSTPLPSEALKRAAAAAAAAAPPTAAEGDAGTTSGSASSSPPPDAAWTPRPSPPATLLEQLVAVFTSAGAADDEAAQFAPHIMPVLKPCIVEAGSVIVQVGDEGDEMYFITDGAVEIVSSTGINLYATKTTGDFFGEATCLQCCVDSSDKKPRTRRTATVRAARRSQLWSLSSADLLPALRAFPKVRDALMTTANDRISQTCAMLAARLGTLLTDVIPDAHRGAFFSQLAPRMRPLSVAEGEHIIRQGEVNDDLFFLCDGEVEILVDGPTPADPHVVVARRTPISFFGEVAALHIGPAERSASVRATSQSLLWRVTAADLQLVLRDFPSIKAILEGVARARMSVGETLSSADAPSPPSPPGLKKQKSNGSIVQPPQQEKLLRVSGMIASSRQLDAQYDTCVAHPTRDKHDTLEQVGHAKTLTEQTIAALERQLASEHLKLKMLENVESALHLSPKPEVQGKRRSGAQFPAAYNPTRKSRSEGELPFI